MRGGRIAVAAAIASAAITAAPNHAGAQDYTANLKTGAVSSGFTGTLQHGCSGAPGKPPGWARTKWFGGAVLAGGHLLRANGKAIEVVHRKTRKVLDRRATMHPPLMICVRSGATLVKTAKELLWIDATSGSIAWHVPATVPRGIPAVAGKRLVDSWVDFKAGDFGIAVLDRATGKELSRITLGPLTGALTPASYVNIEPRGKHVVAVEARFPLPMY